MSIRERDVLVRQVRQLGDAIAAVLGRTRGGAVEDATSGLEAIRSAAVHGLGVDRALLDRLDPDSAVMLLREPEAALAYVDVCRAEAELLEASGCEGEAVSQRERAAAITRVLEGPRRTG